MYQDAHNQFSSAQAVTATAASTNLIDLGAIRNMGVGENLYLVVVCTTAMTDAGSDSTLAVTVETDDNSSFSSATTTQTIGTFAAVSAAGTKLVARIQPDQMNERYVRLKYTPANGNLTTGSFTAFITHDIDAYTSYADGITIS
jgi:uncharacterized protein YdbL (DUF1318 family)